MGDRVTFDYSKAEKFIGEHEVKAMERIALLRRLRAEGRSIPEIKKLLT